MRRYIIGIAIIFYIGCMAYAAITAFPIAAAAPFSPPPISAPLAEITPMADCANTAAAWRAIADDARMHRIGCDQSPTGQWMPGTGRCAAIAYAAYQSNRPIHAAAMRLRDCAIAEDGSYMAHARPNA